MGVRALKARSALRAADDDAPITWDSKVDKFDARKDLVERPKSKRQRSDITVDEVKDTSLYEFYWKFCQMRGRLLRAPSTKVLMVTPSFSADSACVLSDKHNDYARSAVIAYWRLMPTARRLELLREHALMSGVATEADLSVPIRTVSWGRSAFDHKTHRFLGVQDLVMKFDTEKRDAQGRPLGWALALTEMLADPMLLAWVPGWVVEQYERWNPYFRPCIRSALQQ